MKVFAFSTVVLATACTVGWALAENRSAPAKAPASQAMNVVSHSDMDTDHKIATGQIHKAISYYSSERRNAGFGMQLRCDESGTWNVTTAYRGFGASYGGVRTDDSLLTMDGLSLVGTDGFKVLSGASVGQHKFLVRRDGHELVLSVPCEPDFGYRRAKELEDILASNGGIWNDSCPSFGCWTVSGCQPACNGLCTGTPRATGSFCVTYGCNPNCGEP